MAFATVSVPWALYPTAESGILLEALASGTLRPDLNSALEKVE
jgi:hypothetical protein